MKKVVGLIGRIASGKTIVSDQLLAGENTSYYRFSDVLKDVIERVHEENTRENLQELGLALRGVFGDGVLAAALKKDIEADDADLIVVDGIRYDDEYDMVKSLGGVIVYVTAPEQTRYERVLGRATRGEAELSLEDFRHNESKETEKRIDELGENADYIIENTGTLDELNEKVSEVVEKIISQ